VKRLPREVLSVAVFRNEAPQRVVDIALETGVGAVQLHGVETVDDVAFIRSKLPVVTIKAFAAGSDDLRRAEHFGTHLVLLDAPSPGSGKVFDWRLAEGVPDRVRVLLAGGLRPDNVAEAIEAVHPWGVDVVSGVEASPGVKDPAKVRAFIERAKHALPPPVERSQPGPYDWRDDLD
jgi:phosphoribosylanthranilate isomerase